MQLRDMVVEFINVAIQIEDAPVQHFHHGIA
jgi:hypothetical protein